MSDSTELALWKIFRRGMVHICNRVAEESPFDELSKLAMRMLDQGLPWLTEGVPEWQADAARIDALARMVQESAERGETVELDQRGTGGVSLQRWCPLNAVTETVSSGATLRDAIDAAVAAQGGEQQ